MASINKDRPILSDKRLFVDESIADDNDVDDVDDVSADVTIEDFDGERTTDDHFVRRKAVASS